MYIDIIPNRKSRPTVLIREAWRDGKRIRKRTVANITSWPEEKINALKLLLRGERLVRASEAITIERSIPCGHVRALLGMTEKINLQAVISQKSSLPRNIVMALVVEQLMNMSAPHLAERLWDRSTLAEDLGVQGMTQEDFLQALRWLGARKTHIEEELASRGFDESRPCMVDPGRDGAPGILVDLAHHLGWHMASALSPVISGNGHAIAGGTKEESSMHPSWTGCLSLCHGDRAGLAQDMTLGGILTHLASQCTISCRITSIPGAPTYLALSRPTALHVRVRELICSYEMTPQRGPLTWSSFRGFHTGGTTAPASDRPGGNTVHTGPRSGGADETKK
jgi:hypothetical protein